MFRRTHLLCQGDDIKQNSWNEHDYVFYDFIYNVSLHNGALVGESKIKRLHTLCKFIIVNVLRRPCPH